MSVNETKIKFTAMASAGNTYTFTPAPSGGKFIFVKSAAIFWKFHNISAAYRNNTITVGGRTLTFPDSYYTCQDLSQILETQNIKMTYEKITNDVVFDKIGNSTVTVNFGKLGDLLGLTTAQRSLTPKTAPKLGGWGNLT